MRFAMFQHASQSARLVLPNCSPREDTGALTDEALAETAEGVSWRLRRGVGTGAGTSRSTSAIGMRAILGAYFALEMATGAARGAHHRGRGRSGRAGASRLGFGRDGRHLDLVVAEQGAQMIMLDHYAAQRRRRRALRRARSRSARTQHGWHDGTDWVPHDAKVKEWGTGKTRVETMQALGLNRCWCRMATFQDGINAVRRTLPLCVFHPRTEETGIAALEQYRREWDDEKKAFRPSDVHDWTAHPAAPSGICRWRGAACRTREVNQSPSQEAGSSRRRQSRRRGGMQAMTTADRMRGCVTHIRRSALRTARLRWRQSTLGDTADSDAADRLRRPTPRMRCR